MDVELNARIRRVYSAVGKTVDVTFVTVKPVVDHQPGVLTIGFDFTGGVSEEEASNVAHSAIHNIANLKDHIRRWAIRSGKDKSEVERAIDRSRELQVVIDLSNYDKHGPPRDGGRSTLAPRVINISRSMRMRSGPEGTSSLELSFSGPGFVKTTGDVGLVITGEIVDEDGKIVGDLRDFLLRAVEAWEQLLRSFGLDSGSGTGGDSE